METKLESGNGSGFVSKVVESKSNYLPAHHHQAIYEYIDSHFYSILVYSLRLHTGDDGRFF